MNSSILAKGPSASAEKANVNLVPKLQYFGHLMRRVDSLEKTLMLGGIGMIAGGGEGKGVGGSEPRQRHALDCWTGQAGLKPGILKACLSSRRLGPLYPGTLGLAGMCCVRVRRNGTWILGLKAAVVPIMPCSLKAGRGWCQVRRLS